MNEFNWIDLFHQLMKYIWRLKFKQSLFYFINIRNLRIMLIKHFSQQSITFCFLTIFFSCNPKEAAIIPTVVPEVNVVKVGQRTIPVFTEYVGQTYGISDVEIRSRVDGWVISQNFKEGSMVQKGQLLYVIDDLPIRTRIDAAEGRLAEAKTMMVKAKSGQIYCWVKN